MTKSGRRIQSAKEERELDFVLLNQSIVKEKVLDRKI